MSDTTKELVLKIYPDLGYLEDYDKIVLDKNGELYLKYGVIDSTGGRNKFYVQDIPGNMRRSSYNKPFVIMPENTDFKGLFQKYHPYKKLHDSNVHEEVDFSLLNSVGRIVDFTAQSQLKANGLSDLPNDFHFVTIHITDPIAKKVFLEDRTKVPRAVSIKYVDYDPDNPKGSTRWDVVSVDAVPLDLASYGEKARAYGACVGPEAECVPLLRAHGLTEQVPFKDLIQNCTPNIEKALNYLSSYNTPCKCNKVRLRMGAVKNDSSNEEIDVRDKTGSGTGTQAKTKLVKSKNPLKKGETDTSKKPDEEQKDETANNDTEDKETEAQLDENDASLSPEVSDLVKKLVAQEGLKIKQGYENKIGQMTRIGQIEKAIPQRMFKSEDEWRKKVALEAKTKKDVTDIKDQYDALALAYDVVTGSENLQNVNQELMNKTASQIEEMSGTLKAHGLNIGSKQTKSKEEISRILNRGFGRFNMYAHNGGVQ